MAPSLIGRSGEQRFARWLRRNGFKNVRLSPGSRGPTDVYGEAPSGQSFCFQYKVRNGSSSVCLRPMEHRLLLAERSRRGCIPVVVAEFGGRRTFQDARDGRCVSGSR